MIVSICICTHNRFSDLHECLEALVRQVDNEKGEIIVVDSASDSETRQKIVAYTSESPSVRLVRLEEAGLSTARNAAIAASSSDWIAFLDDDAVPFPDYFRSLCQAIAGVSDSVAFFGGRLKPRWPPGAQPAGLRWSRLLSLMDDPSERDTEIGLVYGANIIYRRKALEGLSEPFDPALGRIGTSLKSGEEMGLHLALTDSGYQCRYFGSVGAEHKIAQTRLTLGWLRQRAFWEGITLVALVQKLSKPYPRGANPWWQILKIAALTPRAIFNDPDRDAYIRIWQSIGVIRARLLGTS